MEETHFQDTTATKRIFQLSKKIRAVSGGTSASKTISILVWLIDYCQSTKNKVVTVVGESVPHLTLGAIRDFQNIMISNGYWKDVRWVDKKYTFEDGTILEFISFDKFGKAHGPRRDVLFLNEANYLPYNIADQLITRTRETVWLDWNPTVEFWFYTEMLGKREDVDFIGEGGNYPPLTYKDNEALDENSIKEIESHKHNLSWWKVYGEGKLGEVAGRIYTNWQPIQEIPHEARLERYGVDFGWHPDPCAIVAVYYWNGSYILDEVACQLEMSNREIASTLKNLPRALIIADSAEPKSIAEVRAYGLNIQPTVKGADSVRHGIRAVQDQKIFVTQRSANILKEYRNYLWSTDKDGNTMPGVPEDGNDHTLDAIRYAINSLVPIVRRKEMLIKMYNQPRQNKNIAV